MIRLRDLRDYVSKAIYDVFGSGYKIFAEKVQGTFVEPAFCIQILPGAGRPDGVNHTWTKITVNISFFPAGENDLGNTLAMMNALDKLRLRCFGKSFYVKTQDDGEVVTINATDNKFEGMIREMSENDRVVITTTGTLPAQITAGKEYYAVNVTFDDFQIALTRNGTPINFDAGSGVYSFYLITDRWLEPKNQVHRIADDMLSYQFDVEFSEGLIIGEKYDIMDTLEFTLTEGE